jgi:hypothetical protein
VRGTIRFTVDFPAKHKYLIIYYITNYYVNRIEYLYVAVINVRYLHPGAGADVFNVANKDKLLMPWLVDLVQGIPGAIQTPRRA